MEMFNIGVYVYIFSPPCLNYVVPTNGMNWNGGNLGIKSRLLHPLVFCYSLKSMVLGCFSPKGD